MSLYMPVKAHGSVALAICPRCQRKVYQDDLRQDPNNKNWYCAECVDVKDPWTLPARRPEDISVAHPRPDVELV